MREPWKMVNIADVPEVGQEGASYKTMQLTPALDLRQLRANVFCFRPGDRMEYHNHDWQEELLYVVEGEATLLVEGERHPVRAGDALRFAPPPRRHVVNDGAGECLFFAAGAPPVDEDWGEFPEGEPTPETDTSGWWAITHVADLATDDRGRYLATRLADALGLQQLRANLFRFRPGDSMYLHAHRYQEELFYILEGEADLVVGGDRRRVRPGDVIRVDKEPGRQLANASEGECVWLAIGAPPVRGETIFME